MPYLRPFVLLSLAPIVSGCGLFGKELPNESVPLADMEEPTAYFEEPDDEAERRALPAGAFSGLRVGDVRQSLESMLGDPEGLRVTGVVENSPAVAAGLEEGDVLYEAAGPDGEWSPLAWPADWRAFELDLPAGQPVKIRFERNGRELETCLTLVPRLSPRGRQETERYREEARAGFVVRTATEVEARRAGLPAGAGAVIVGLSARSPLKQAGLDYGDLITHADGEVVSDPRELLESVQKNEREEIRLSLVRAGERRDITAPLTERESEIRNFHIPPLYRYTRNRDRRRTSMLLGLFVWESTPVAWNLRLLWLFGFSGGESDRLEEVAP